MASAPTVSKLPPMPTPTTVGGQGLPPAESTASSTNSLTPASPETGVSIFTRHMFSLPAPLGATVIFSPSPGTMRAFMAAGVLSPVFTRLSGSRTTLLRR